MTTEFKTGNKTSITFYAWVALLLVALLPGAYAAIKIIMDHSLIASGISWGIFIATYVFFVVSSTGMCILSSFGHVFKVKEYEVIGRRAVFLSIITLMSGFIPLLLHLGHIERMPNFLLSPNLSSSMFWMSFFYSLYLFFMILEFWRLLAHDMKWAQIMGGLGLLSGVSAHSILGTLFSRLEARPLWYGAYYPLYFILSAMITAAAILTFMPIVTYWARKKELSTELREFLTGPFRKLFAFLLFVGMMFLGWKITASVRHIETYEILNLMLSGPLSFRFWALQVMLGLVVPFLILMFPKTGKSTLGLSIASLCVLIGIYSVRYDWVIAGQLIPIIPLYEGLLHYSVTFLEASVVLLAFAVCGLLYTIGVKLLPLDE